MNNDIIRAVAKLQRFLQEAERKLSSPHLLTAPVMQLDTHEARVIVGELSRIAELEQQPEKKVLSIWFTRQSAQEFLDRLIDKCIESPDGFWLDLAVQRTKPTTTVD